MTAIPWGQKKKTSASTQSQMVTPPLAAIEGTTFRFTIATTNSRIKSMRPSTRFRFGAALVWAFSIGLVSDGDLTALLLSDGQVGRDLRKGLDVAIDVCLRVRDRDRPLLVPVMRLRHHSAIHHGEPIMAPQVDVYGRPVAMVLNFLGIEHHRTVGDNADCVRRQTRLLDY